MSVTLLAATLLAISPQVPVDQYGPDMRIPEIAGVTGDPTCKDTPSLAATTYCGWTRWGQINDVMRQYSEAFEAQGLVADIHDGNRVFRRPAAPAACSALVLSGAVENGTPEGPEARVLIMIRHAPRCERMPIAGEGPADGARLTGIPRLDGVQRDPTCGGQAPDQIGPTEYCATVPNDRANDVFAAYAASLLRQNLEVREQGDALIFNRHQGDWTCDVMKLHRRSTAGASAASMTTIVLEGLGGDACTAPPQD